MMVSEGDQEIVKRTESQEGVVEDVTYKYLTKKDLRKSWWNWMYYFQSCYNYERMQGVGFLHAMTYVIKRLYHDDPEQRKAAMRKRILERVSLRLMMQVSLVRPVSFLRLQKRNHSRE